MSKQHNDEDDMKRQLKKPIAAMTIILCLLSPPVLSRRPSHGIPLLGSIFNLEKTGLFNGVSEKNPLLSTITKDRVKALHETLFIADMHADSLLWNRNLLKESKEGHVDLPRLQKGNISFQVFSTVTKAPLNMFIDSNNVRKGSDLASALAIQQGLPLKTWFSAYQRALYQARKYKSFIKHSGGAWVDIQNQSDLDNFLDYKNLNPKKNIVGSFLAVEGLHAIEGSIKKLEELFKLGFRMMSPTHFFDNKISGSAHGRKKYGLTKFGRKIFQKMGELGIIPDMSHASAKTIRDVLKITGKPVISSHGGVNGTKESGERNLDDEQIIAIAETGGIIGIGYWEVAVGEGGASATARAIRYVADLVGVEYVGLGSDFDGAVKAHFDTSYIIMITEALIEEGFTDSEIRLIMGENFLRVMRASLPN